jgi:hypothetical protein
VSFIDDEAVDDDDEEEEEEEEEDDDDMDSFIVEEEEEEEDEEEEDAKPKKSKTKEKAPSSTKAKAARDSMLDGYGARSTRPLSMVNAKKKPAESDDDSNEQLALDLESPDDYDAEEEPPRKQKAPSKSLLKSAKASDSSLDKDLMSALQQASESLGAKGQSSAPTNVSANPPSWLANYLGNNSPPTDEETEIGQLLTTTRPNPPSVSALAPEAAESANRALMGLAASTSSPSEKEKPRTDETRTPVNPQKATDAKLATAEVPATTEVRTNEQGVKAASHQVDTERSVPRILTHASSVRCFTLSFPPTEPIAYYEDCKTPFIRLSKEKCIGYPAAVVYEAESNKSNIAPVVLRQFCMANVTVGKAVMQTLTCRLQPPTKKPFGFAGTAKQWSQIAQSTWIVEDYQRSCAMKSHSNLKGAALVTSLEYSLGFQTGNRVTLMSTNKPGVRFIVYLADEAVPITPEAIAVSPWITGWIPIRVRSAKAMNSVYMRQAAYDQPPSICDAPTMTLLKRAISTYTQLVANKDEKALRDHPIPDVDVELELTVIKENDNAALQHRGQYMDNKGVLMDPNLLHDLTKPRVPKQRKPKEPSQSDSDDDDQEQKKQKKPSKSKEPAPSDSDDDDQNETKNKKKKPKDKKKKKKKKKTKKERADQSDSDDDDRVRKGRTDNEAHTRADSDFDDVEEPKKRKHSDKDQRKKHANGAASAEKRYKVDTGAQSNGMASIAREIIAQPEELRAAFHAGLQRSKFELSRVRTLSELKESMFRTSKPDSLLLLLAGNEQFMKEYNTRMNATTSTQSDLLKSLLG